MKNVLSIEAVFRGRNKTSILALYSLVDKKELPNPMMKKLQQHLFYSLLIKQKG